MELLQQLGPWGWRLGAVALFVGEMLIPGTFLVWFGLGAAMTGVLLLIFPALAWQAQWIVFAVLSVASVFVWRRYRSRHPETSDHPILNQRGRNYVGRRFTLASPIVDGVGKLHVDDTSWKISGANLPAGSHVKVVGVEGTMLKVEAVEDTP
jgi:membrane protein implicated in regulation of membrane protease activity